jgi:hypothetical protein
MTWALLLLHAVSTWGMVGVIWFVQIVQYPLFAVVSPASFVPFHTAHMRQTTYVVLPLMLVEALTAVALAFQFRTLGDWKVSGLSLGLLTAAWGSTFLIQVPMHERLTLGFDSAVIERLVSTNWIRTAAWSGRGVVAAFLLTKTAAAVHQGAA